MNKQRFADKVVVLTGASGGIGEAAARELAARGAHLCLVARREDELKRVQTAIHDAGGRAAVFAAHLSRGDEAGACAQAIRDSHGHVDILINNAGRSIRRPILDALDRLHDYQRTMRINYFAAVQLTLAFLPDMLERDSGQIINISSYATLMPAPRFTAYAGSKGALEAFSYSLAAELVGSGIAVTVINYPLVRTPMAAATDIYAHAPMMELDEAAAWIVHAVNKRPARIARLPARTVATAKAFAPATTTAVMARAFSVWRRRLRRKLERGS